MESKQFKVAKELLNRKLKELGAIDENKAQRVCDSLYDENRDKEIVALSIKQKCALLNAAASLYTTDNMPNNRQEAKQVLVEFMQLLGLEDKHLTYCIHHQSWLDRKKYIDIMKTIQKDGTYDYVGFHSQLGELTPAEISKRKKELKVGLTESGKYVLYDHIDDWEIVDLGL